MAFFVKLVKEYLVDKSIADEELVRELFNPYIEYGFVNDKNNNPFELNKSRVSRLLSQLDDVPVAMRKKLTMTGLRGKMTGALYETIEDLVGKENIFSLTGNIQSEIESSSNIRETTKTKLKAILGQPEQYLCEAFFEAVRVDNHNKPQNVGRCLWRRGENSLWLQEGDLLHQGSSGRKKVNCIITIPVNTAFDTKLSWIKDNEQNPIVSPQTIHGKWIQQWIQKGDSIDHLKDQIFESINQQNYPVAERYPIGTIAEVKKEHTIYYLLAVSTFDNHNIAHSSKEEIKTALVSLLTFYNLHGQGYPIYIPLIGTGRSRASLGYENSLSLIRNTLIENENLFYGKLTILARREAINEIGGL